MPENNQPSTDKVIDEIVKICRDVKKGDQFSALWKLFNIMAEFIKGQSRLITAIDGRIKIMELELAALKKELKAARKSDSHLVH